MANIRYKTKEDTRTIRATSNTLVYNMARCINCDMCSIVCPHGLFIPGENVAQLPDPEPCMECGACMINCPTSAIYVDAGVGCAAAMINAALTGKDTPCCGPDDAGNCAC